MLLLLYFMIKNISKKINKINLKFYDDISLFFNETRKTPWQGWMQLLKYFNFKTKLDILDLGCGNARFAKFLTENLNKSISINYVGIDFSKDLLNLGTKELLKIQKERKNFKFKLINLNFIEENFNLNKKFDLIVLFGVMHHIYDEKIRIILFNKINLLLNKNDQFIFTTWQFLNNERQRKKILDLNSEKGKNILEKFDLNKKYFKNNKDYILSWNMGKEAFRYCRNYLESDIFKLTNETNFKIKNIFFADGKEKNLNQYFFCYKK